MTGAVEPRYLVGIDLGTTHTVVSYVDLQANGQPQPHLFEIEQWVGPGEVARRPMLPSFRYHPAAGEIPQEQLILPWREERLPGDDVPYLVGEYARTLGSRVEGRQIASAKSWLSHDKVDRSAAILPWSAADDVQKVSPVVACASYLLHVRCAWNHDNPDHPLHRQDVVITIPASFDEAARSLTLQAAELAGLDNITLLEEPQAVCYDWYYRFQDQAEQTLADVRLLLVVDVGGGTTDLSLIRVGSDSGKLSLDRIAVGDHWMLGGDNVDLAMARIAEQRLCENGKPLTASALTQLIQQCRHAKELLLSHQPQEQATVTVVGGGSRLIGGARSAVLSRAEVHGLALDGFFPLIDFGEKPQKRMGAIVEFGLPYAPDPAVSRYISLFLSQHQESCRKALGLGEGQVAIPDAVLFNGGVFNSPVLYDRALAVLGNWRGDNVTTLENNRPDLAVAYGAAAFALARRSRTLRIGGGSARSYFLQVESRPQEGKEAESLAVCVLPKGTEEGLEVALPEREFALQVNQPVQFLLASYNGDEAFQPGQIVELDYEAESSRFQKLPPLVAALELNEQEMGRQEQGGQVAVSLVTRLTEVGTLDLYCQSLSDQRRWQVEFQLRKTLRAHHQVSRHPRLQEAIDIIEEVYGASDKSVDSNAVKRLRATLEKILGSRSDWDTELARSLFDALWERRKKRRRSQLHEKLWFNLAGFCIRPGFGHPADDWRIDQVWSLFQQGLQFDKENQSWAEWWTFWRRLAGGLDSASQQQIYRKISKFLNPASLRNLKLKTEIKNKSYEDMVRLAGSLEELPVSTKLELATWFRKRLEKASETQTTWWALGRLAAREPFHGGLQTVLPPDKVEPILASVMKQDWRKNQNAAFAAVMMARVTSDRSRDLPEVLRLKVQQQLESAKAPELWQKLVTECIELDETDNKRIFGEALPVGLTLLNSPERTQ